jgi:dinuclear metal center YbgI/SA1388 family protein
MNTIVKVKDVTAYLETLAPRAYQESYDNAGLITGDPNMPVTGILTTLDCTEPVVEEAIQGGVNLIVAHHPIVFRGLKRLNGSNYVERTVIKAIKHDIAIYAIHTNLDNVYAGVNRKICEKIGLQNLRILSPKTGTLSKLVTFVPPEYTAKVLDALHRAGAGQIGNYKNCSFKVEGTGTFQPTEAANPFQGEANKQESVHEDRIEVLVASHLEYTITEALRASHPYEEVAYYLTALHNENQEIGAGMVGELPFAMEPGAFLEDLKVRMGLRVVRHTSFLPGEVRKVAVCGGAGSFLLGDAIRAGADVFVSADFKYHEFFDADGRILIADIGHYESEVHTKELLKDVLIKKFPTFAINFSETLTNPISYL